MSDEYLGIVLEEVRDQNKIILEAVGQIQDQMNTFVTKDELQIVVEDVKTIKIALAETNHEVKELRHDVRELKLALA